MCASVSGGISTHETNLTAINWVLKNLIVFPYRNSHCIFKYILSDVSGEKQRVLESFGDKDSESNWSQFGCDTGVCYILNTNLKHQKKIWEDGFSSLSL